MLFPKVATRSHLDSHTVQNKVLQSLSDTPFYIHPLSSLSPDPPTVVSQGCSHHNQVLSSIAYHRLSQISTRSLCKIQSRRLRQLHRGLHKFSLSIPSYLSMCTRLP